jgi:cytoplasmic iron level regulating protein YaaA (DUF328/UPF0246 family)
MDMLMITLLSPAKSLDYTTLPTLLEHSIPKFLNQSQTLINGLKKLSVLEISQLMDVSENIASLNHERFQNWSKEDIQSFNPLNLHQFEKTKQAILAFNGDVYDGLQASTLSLPQLYYAQFQIRILSGLYGLLKPLDLIQPYRLEMGTTYPVGKNKNLYQFWGDTITLELLDHLELHHKEFNRFKAIINCASEEYFKSVNVKLLEKHNIPLVNPVFMHKNKNNEYKTIAIFAKKARGHFARFILDEKIHNINDLNAFSDWNQLGYRVDLELSNKLSEGHYAKKIVFKN